MPRYRVPFLAGAGVQTDDGRTFDTVTWRTLPLPLAFQTDTQHADGATSELVGQIVELAIAPDGTVDAVLDVDPRDGNGRAIHPEGARAAQMIEQGGQGISIDGLLPIDATITEECVQVDEDGWCLRAATRFSEVVIGGATLTPIPAFAQAIVAPDRLDEAGQPIGASDVPMALVASAGPIVSLLARSDLGLTAGAAAALAGWAPDPAHFTAPTDLEPDGNLINLADGRIFGWLATDACHASFPGTCVRAADQSRDLSRFLRNDGAPLGLDCHVGFLTMDRPHAGRHDTARSAEAHYDDTRAIVAVVTAGWDGDRIWFSGSHRPDLSDWDRTVLTAAAASGDWRANAGEADRTLRAALVVPVPGFGRDLGYATTMGRNTATVPASHTSNPYSTASTYTLTAAGAGTAPTCGCGGADTRQSAPPLTAAQTKALARLADDHLDAELDTMPAAIVDPLDGLPEAI